MPGSTGARGSNDALHQVKLFAKEANLAVFYQDALDCQLFAHIDDFADPGLSRGFKVPRARVRLAFLGLPGIEEGPILELYQFPDEGQSEWPLSVRTGPSHLSGR